MSDVTRTRTTLNKIEQIRSARESHVDREGPSEGSQLQTSCRIQRIGIKKEKGQGKKQGKYHGALMILQRSKVTVEVSNYSKEH